MLKASPEFYIISTEIAQLLQTNTPTYEHKWAKPTSKYFLFLFLLPLPQHHPPQHIHTTFSEFPRSILSHSLTPPHAQKILLTYPLTHTHPRCKNVLVVKFATAAPPLLLRSSSSSQSSSSPAGCQRAIS